MIRLRKRFLPQWGILLDFYNQGRYPIGARFWCQISAHMIPRCTLFVEPFRSGAHETYHIIGRRPDGREAKRRNEAPRLDRLHLLLLRRITPTFAALPANRLGICGVSPCFLMQVDGLERCQSPALMGCISSKAHSLGLRRLQRCRRKLSCWNP